jgi:hypothetical protein
LPNSAILQSPIFSAHGQFFGASFALFGRQFGHLATVMELNFMTWRSVLPRGRNFGRRTKKNPKGAAEKSAKKRICQKRVEKGPNFLKTHVSGIFCKSSEMNAFLSLLYSYIFLQFVSFWFIFFFQKQAFM